MGQKSEDSIDGVGGNDNIYGGQDNDSLKGNKGHDKLFGGPGNDTLDGGPGMTPSKAAKVKTRSSTNSIQATIQLEISILAKTPLQFSHNQESKFAN